jgi:5S rRNA maturation endonuclease (ribonuclease M5)
MSYRDEIIAANPIEGFLRGRGHKLIRSSENFVTSACPVGPHEKPGHRPVTIDVGKQVWHCNDHNVGGSVIDWLKTEKNISLIDAMRELGGGSNDQKPRGKIVRVHDYTDERGKLLFQVCRFEPKKFSARHPDGKGGWIWNMKGVRRVLYHVAEVIAAETVIVTAGEKDADNLRALGFTATTNPFGEKKWQSDYSETLRGKDVIVIGDNDAKGRAHVEQVIQALTGIARSLKRAVVPTKFKDVSDFIRSLLPTERKRVVTELIESAPIVPPPESIPARFSSPLPKVELPGDNRLLSEFADECAQIVKSCGIYQHGGIAMIVNDDRDGLEVITPAMLRTLVERHLVCYHVKRTREGEFVKFSRTMSSDAAEGVLNAKQFLGHLPKVRRIATTRLPIMRKSGAIELLPNGYDRESMTLTLSQCDYHENLPPQKAVRIIDDLFSEFPFAKVGQSKAVAVSATVGLYGTGLVKSKALRPVFVNLANAEGAGKTLLSICAITPTHGETKISGQLNDDAETKKELLAVLIEARPYILFDNVKGHLDSPSLEAFTTSTYWSDRILGVNKMFSGENLMTVFVTGNGCTVSPDIRRRSLFVELFMEQERAEDRSFKRELDQRVLLELRPKILAALWALVRQWNQAGRPSPSRTHSAFPEWSRTIGGIVECAGYACPFMPVEIQAAADIDGAHMRKLVVALAEGGPANFDVVVELCYEHGLFERLEDKEGRIDRHRLGWLLKRYDRRIFPAGHFIIEGAGHRRTFCVSHK